MGMAAFLPSSPWLLLQARHDTVDVVVAVIITTLALTQKLWFRHLPISDNIPRDFWYQVPQHASGHSDTTTSQTESIDIKHVFSERDLDMVVFWASQSGRAEMLARRLAKGLNDRYKLKVLAADVAGTNPHSWCFSSSGRWVWSYSATYGDGDPPDNGNGLWSVLHRLQADRASLNGLRYVIFGLGNSNYRQFNRVAERVDMLLQSMGAMRIGPTGRGDDASGETEDAFLPWRRACEDTLKEQLQLIEQARAYKPSFTIREDTLASQQVHLGIPRTTISDKTHHAPIKPMQTSQICKLWEDDARVCIHADLDLGKDRLVKYKTGDHLAIWPSNPDSEVNRLISLLNIEEKQHTPIHIALAAGEIAGEKMPVPSPTTVRTLLRYYLEICAALSQETVRDLGLFAPSDDARFEIRRITEDRRVFKADVLRAHASLADVLAAVGTGARWDIPLSFFLERLKPMKPRYYSISSSTIVQPRTVSVTAVVTKPPQRDDGSGTLARGCYGLTTTYLSALERSINGDAEGTSRSWPPTFALGGPGSVLEGGKAFGQVRQSLFKLPVKASVPIIMVGAGTGVAPFRAFVQERARMKDLGQEVGKTLLFMGFRHPDVDFIHREDWMEWREALGQDVFKYWAAFSRNGGSRKVYVQDLLRENAGEAMGLLTGNVGCRLYICGSAAMARDVVVTLVGMKMEFSSDDEEKASAWTKHLRQSKQLLEDVWG